MGVRPTAKELRRYGPNAHLFGHGPIVRVERPVHTTICPPCGWRNTPEGHDCLHGDTLLKLFAFAYIDGPYVFAVSKVDPSRMIRAKFGPYDYPTDKAICTLAGVNRPEDFMSADMGKRHKVGVRGEENLQLLAIAKCEDYEPFRRMTQEFARNWENVAPVLGWARLTKDVPPVWRRVAMGDLTILLEEPEPKFRGRDPYLVEDDAPPVVSYTRGGEGAERKVQAEVDLMRYLRELKGGQS